MNKRMHIRGIHVVLFIPGGGGQYNIGEKTGAGHAEIERHQQIELALNRAALPFHLFRLHVVRTAEILALNAAFRAQQIAQHVLMAFAGGAQQVRAPDKHIAWMVASVIRQFAGEAHVPGFKSLYRIVDGRHPGVFRLRGQMQRVHVQLGRGREPAHALGAYVEINQVAGKVCGVRQRRQQLPGSKFFIAPLAGVIVEKRRAVHLTRRAVPVQRECQRQPAGLRPQLFLADIVRPAAAGLSDAAAEHQDIDHSPVVHVHVVPVVDPRAEDDH